MKKPTWRDLQKYIEAQILAEGDQFLDQQIMLECVDPKHVDPEHAAMDSDGWTYTSPMWDEQTNSFYTTTWPDKTIKTLNINY